MFAGTICYWRGNIKWITNEIQLYKPTILGLVPRLLVRIYGTIVDKLKVAGWLANMLFSRQYGSTEA